MKICVMSLDPMYSEGLGCLLTHGGGCEVVSCQSHLGGVARSLLDQGEPALFVLTEDMLDPTNLTLLRKYRQTGALKLVLVTGPGASVGPTSDFDLVVTPWMGTGALFGALRSLGAVRQEQAPAAVPSRQKQSLSERERAAASHIVLGRTNREIAELMGVSEQSVKNYMRSLMLKMGCRNRLQLCLALSELGEEALGTDEAGARAST